jgi:hypothetical protein
MARGLSASPDAIHDLRARRLMCDGIIAWPPRCLFMSTEAVSSAVPSHPSTWRERAVSVPLTILPLPTSEGIPKHVLAFTGQYGTGAGRQGSCLIVHSARDRSSPSCLFRISKGVDAGIVVDYGVDPQHTHGWTGGILPSWHTQHSPRACFAVSTCYASFDVLSSVGGLAGPDLAVGIF